MLSNKPHTAKLVRAAAARTTLSRRSSCRGGGSWQRIVAPTRREKLETKSSRAYFLSLILGSALFAALPLLAALIAGGWSQPVAYLIPAIVAGVLAAMLFTVGMNRRHARNLAPRETPRQLEKDRNSVKEIVR